ncbi:hypothetical protein IW261DRAFT_271401 [Armillaria novae-zelandiae]|uniref:Secreted protein n=1 Tax=Armillaria novae-zelandiae TaxID=153914 RepID=A0AA39U514_9AGAR|nr:hypothetical protein IW261DRAFT_271401 [Armillaria novae-zelandiae]
MRHTCILCLAAVAIALEIKRRKMAMTTSGAWTFLAPKTLAVVTKHVCFRTIPIRFFLAHTPLGTHEMLVLSSSMFEAALCKDSGPQVLKGPVWDRTRSEHLWRAIKISFRLSRSEDIVNDILEFFLILLIHYERNCARLRPTPSPTEINYVWLPRLILPLLLLFVSNRYSPVIDAAITINWLLPDATSFSTK